MTTIYRDHSTSQTGVEDLDMSEVFHAYLYRTRGWLSCDVCGKKFTKAEAEYWLAKIQEAKRLKQLAMEGQRWIP